MTVVSLERCFGGIIENEDSGKIVIVNKVNGSRDEHGDPIVKWSLPKGGPEGKETPIETLLRELRQEAGIKTVNILQEMGSYSRLNVKSPERSVLKRITLYYGMTSQKKLTPQEHEKHEAFWMYPEEVAERLTFDADRHALRKALAQICRS